MAKTKVKIVREFRSGREKTEETLRIAVPKGDINGRAAIVRVSSVFSLPARPEFSLLIFAIKP